MAKPKQPITERQQYWLGHVKAADASPGSVTNIMPQQVGRTLDICRTQILILSLLFWCYREFQNFM